MNPSAKAFPSAGWRAHPFMRSIALIILSVSLFVLNLEAQVVPPLATAPINDTNRQTVLSNLLQVGYQNISTNPLFATNGIATNRPGGPTNVMLAAGTNLPPAVGTQAQVRTPPMRVGTNALTTLPAARTNAPPALPTFPAFPAPPPPVVAPGAQPTNVAARPLPAPATNAFSLLDDNEIIPVINFPGMPLEQVLDFYAAKIAGRTLLRPATLPAPNIIFKSQTPLTRKEARQALDSVLALNLITMIPVGEKFITVVPAAQSWQEGAAFSKEATERLPEASQYITHVVQLKYMKPSEVVPLIQTLAKSQNAILPLENNQMIVLRDYAINIKRMLEVIEKVDVFVPLEFTPEVIPIKYALAEDIASVLSSLTASGGGASPVGRSTRPTRGGASRRQTGTTQTGIPGQINPANPVQQQAGGQSDFQRRLTGIVNRAAAGGIQVLGEVQIIPDSRVNALLVFANKEDMKMIKSIIEKLDVVLPQVLIEAIIMEVSLGDTRTLGVSMLQHPKGNNYFTGVGGINNGQPFISSFTNLAGNIPGGFSYFGQFGNDFDVALQAIAGDSTINVLSRPRIQTSHAEPAFIFVGSTVPYITGTYFNGFSGAGNSSQYQQKDIGIQLEVTPLINADGLVIMNIDQLTIEQLGTPTTIDGNAVPTTTKRQATAKVAVHDRDTIILGGFINSLKSRTKTGVPFLKDIPLLGAAFRKKDDSNSRTELIVLMRPTVLPTPEAAAVTATAERALLPGVRQAEREIVDEERKRRERYEQGKRVN